MTRAAVPTLTRPMPPEDLVEDLGRAAARPPEIAAAQIAGVCGTCLARVA